MAETNAPNWKTLADYLWKIGLIILVLGKTYWSGESNDKAIGELKGRMEKVETDVKQLVTDNEVRKALEIALQKAREQQRLEQDIGAVPNARRK
jgi:type VI protein secretion system component VasK